MSAKTLIPALLIFIVTNIFAQTPAQFSYQSVVRDANGQLIINQAIGIKVSILKSSSSGSIVYAEEHIANTNNNGLLSLIIGNGVNPVNTIESINWANDLYFIKIQMDLNGGTNYTLESTTQLLSVPYALQANSVTNGWSTKGNTGTISSANYIGTNDSTSLVFKSFNGEVFRITPNGRIGVGTQNPSKKMDVWGELKAYRLIANGGYTVNYSLAVGDSTLFSNSSGIYNTAIGYWALRKNSVGGSNTAVGVGALRYNISGSYNTAVGRGALVLNESGNNNSALGYDALNNNKTGIGNTAVGYKALTSNTNGFSNTAIGDSAMCKSTSGNSNTSVGYKSLLSNTVGEYNVAIGSYTLANNISGNNGIAIGYRSQYYACNTATTFDNNNISIGYEALVGGISPSQNIGNRNIALGYRSLYSNVTGVNNVSIGHQSLYNNDDGKSNISIGYNSLYQNTLGSENVAIGSLNLRYNQEGGDNTAVGHNSMDDFTGGLSNVALGAFSFHNLSSGDYNVALGAIAGTNLLSGNNNIAIGYNAFFPNPNGSNQVIIGNNQTSYAGIQVPWTITSDIRWKENIKDLSYGLNLIKALRPVDYSRKSSNGSKEIGFIAQEVEKALIEVGYTDQGMLTKTNNGYLELRYNDLIGVLVKAVQEQNQLIENQNKELQKLNARMLHLEEANDSKTEAKLSDK